MVMNINERRRGKSRARRAQAELVRGLLASLCVLSAVPSLAAADPRKFEIEAGSALEALTQFGRQSGLQMFFARKAIEGRRTQAVLGELEPEAALSLLLQGSGLTFEFINERTVTVTDERRSSPRGAPTKKTTSQTGVWDSLRLAQADSPSLTGGDTAESASSSAQPARMVEEVVVTARKRAENVQNVPLSIAVVTAADIDRRGLVGAEDYLRGIPGVNQVSEPQGQSIVIRGLESSPAFQNFFSGPTVATYFGETPTTNTGGLGFHTNIDLKLVDIERVEVLRGPQGTSFGNSSLGGVVRTIPVAPQLARFEGKVAAGYSATSGAGGNNDMIYAIGNVPLVKDRLALRVTAYRYEDSGFYENVAGSDPAFLVQAATTGTQAFAADDKEVGASTFTGGRIGVLFQANDALKFTFSYLTQETEVDGQPFANTGTYEQRMLQTAPETVRRGQHGGLFDTDIDLANATVQYDLSWADLLATYSYTKSESLFVTPGTPASPISVFGPSEHREHSGEIRLVTQLDGAWDFIAGLYGEDLDDERAPDLYYNGSPIPLAFGTQRLIGTTREQRNLKQKAVFGEASWKFLPGFTLTGGLRVYDYDRTSQITTAGAFFGAGAAVGPELATDASGTSLRGNLSYRLGDNALIYAGWAEGFRLGRPQSGLAASQCDVNPVDGVVDGTGVTIESTRSVDSDDVENYEIGGKFSLLDRRLTITADVYRIDWNGLPVRVVAPCNFAYTANAASARSEGIEFQTSFHVTEAFRIDLGGSWIRAELTDDASGLIPPAFDGDRLPGSPAVNANLGLQYEFKVGDSAVFVRADPIYVGSFHGDLRETANTKAGGYVKVDASARVAFRRLAVDLFARNLTNVDDFTFRGTSDRGDFYGYRPRPRTIGLQLAYSF